MENKVPAETRYDDITGISSMNFRNGADFNMFASEVAGINLNQYQPIILRIYIHSEVIITIYAIDKTQYEEHKLKTGKLLARKFKLDISLKDLFAWFKQIDFTLVSGNYNIEDLDVIN
jgi:hypothetical protein